MVVVGLAVAASSLAAPPAAVARDEPVPLAYTCQFPFGAQPVGVVVTATFPSAGVPGESIEPADVTIAVTLPQPALTELAALSAVTVVSEPSLTTTVRQGESAGDAVWDGNATPSTPIPTEGELALVSSAVVPPVTASEPGEVTFAAGELTIDLAGFTADGTSIDPMAITCALAPGTDAYLGTVAVAGPDPGLDAGAGPDLEIGRVPDATADPQLLADPPPECKFIDDGAEPYLIRGCAHLTGFANVAKLDASVRQPAGILNIAATALNPVVGRCADPDFPWPPWLCQRVIAEPSYGGEPKMPPLDGSFVNFGFVPTTARMQLTQIGFARVNLTFTGVRPFYGYVEGLAHYVVRVYDATVNGVPLDVGPSCQTEIDIEITGTYPEYTTTPGGVLHGMFDIPPFTGCGATEDLDPLLTGAISGPGNYAKLTQGPLCTWTSGSNCPPEVPDPQR